MLAAVQHRPVLFVPRKKVVSGLPGEWPSPFEGKGYEVRACRDFALGDDPRRISASVTARRGIKTVVERVALREFKVSVVLDGSASMGLREKGDIQLRAAALLLYSAWKAETTFGLGVSNGSTVTSFGLGLGSRHFHRLYRVLWSLRTGVPTRGERRPLNCCLPPNAMLLYCSDFLEEAGDPACLRRMLLAVRRYDFVPLIIQDGLEYGFPSISEKSLVSFTDSESGKRKEIWLSPERARQIRALHEERFNSLIGELTKRDIGAIHLDDSHLPTISRKITRYFKQR